MFFSIYLVPRSLVTLLKVAVIRGKCIINCITEPTVLTDPTIMFAFKWSFCPFVILQEYKMKGLFLVEPVVGLYSFSAFLIFPLVQQYVYRRLWQELTNTTYPASDNTSRCAPNNNTNHSSYHQVSHKRDYRSRKKDRKEYFCCRLQLHITTKFATISSCKWSKSLTI